LHRLDIAEVSCGTLLLKATKGATAVRDSTCSFAQRSVTRRIAEALIFSSLIAFSISFAPDSVSAAVQQPPAEDVFTWGQGTGSFSPQQVTTPGTGDDVQVENWGGMEIAPGGRVWDWVLNEGVDTIEPVEVSEVRDAVSVGGGGPQQIAGAVTGSGDLWTWGYDPEGVLCNGKVTDTDFAPARVSGITNAVEVTGGAVHLAFLESNGTVWGCGGTGTLGRKVKKNGGSRPVKVPGLHNVIQIAAGADYTLALESNGSVWAWGNDEYGELGNGETTQSVISPVRVHLPSRAVQVYGGGGVPNSGAVSIALLADGQVWEWGSDQYGQLGNGMTETGSDVPVESTALPDDTWSAVAVAGATAYAVDSSGNLYAWGDDNDGSVGDGNDSGYVLTPALVETGVTKVTATAGTVETLVEMSEASERDIGAR
jgi:alpha-tubulin suppressor-like RCC1 family protein